MATRHRHMVRGAVIEIRDQIANSQSRRPFISSWSWCHKGPKAAKGRGTSKADGTNRRLFGAGDVVKRPHAT